MKLQIKLGVPRPLHSLLDSRRSTKEHVRGFTEPSSDNLLPDLSVAVKVFTLVLDLSETLIYSDWKLERGWRTFKRPGVDAFLEHLSQFYEIVLYTDQLLPPPTCADLSMLNRDPSRILYLSGNALETSLQPENCVPIKSWTGEIEDTAILDYIPFLEFVATRKPPDICEVLPSFQDRDIPKEFIERSKEYHCIRSNSYVFTLNLDCILCTYGTGCYILNPVCTYGTSYYVLNLVWIIMVVKLVVVIWLSRECIFSYL